jgi:hypothetical protein
LNDRNKHIQYDEIRENKPEYEEGGAHPSGVVKDVV